MLFAQCLQRDKSIELPSSDNWRASCLKTAMIDLTIHVSKEYKMFRYSKAIALLFLAGALSLAAPVVSHADTIIAYSLNDGLSYTVALDLPSLTSPASVSFTAGTFTVNIASLQ